MSAFDAYVQAAFHGGTMPGGPTFTTVHDAETPLDYGYADAIADFFRRGPKAGTSAHAMVGPEKAVKLLPDNVVAWAAGPYANPRGWHLEQTGYARFSRADWTTPKGIAQIGRTANCVREVHDTWSIPKRWVTDDQLRRAAKGDRASGGMTTHQQVARVLGGTTHTDPEERYPRDLLLQAVSGGSPINPTPDVGDDDMRLIQSNGRGIAIIGPGYFKQLPPNELGVAISLYGSPKVTGDAEFDLARSVATGGQAITDGKPLLGELHGKVVGSRFGLDGRPGEEKDDMLGHILSIRGALAELATGGVDVKALAAEILASMDVKTSVQEALREGTGTAV